MTCFIVINGYDVFQYAVWDSLVRIVILGVTVLTGQCVRRAVGHASLQVVTQVGLNQRVTDVMRDILDLTATVSIKNITSKI